MNNKKVIAVTIMSIMGISLPVFHSDSVSAYTASISTSNNISLDIMPTGDGTTIHSESINVVSDCRTGYNLTIATPSGSNLYKYTNNVASNTASFTPVDGTSALSSNNNTNKWGYTLTNNPTSSTIFSPLSSTASTIKTSTETASPDNDIDDIFNINYGIKADSSVEPGNYQMADDGNGNAGSIVYYLTMDTTCTQYTVQFNPNGGTVTGGGNNPTQGIESGTPTKLLSSDSLTAPTTASYTDANNNTINGNADKLWTFWGWNTQADGTGDWYKDREEVEDLASVGSTITLYAQWKQATLSDMVAGTPAGTEKTIDHNLMQDMSPETCYNSNAYSTDTSSPANTPYDPSTNPGGYHTITLLDYRGKFVTDDPLTSESPSSYTVSKLADGLCWMTSNLYLGRDPSIDLLGQYPDDDSTVTLTSDDTDLAEGTTFVLPAADTSSYTATTNLAKVRLTNSATIGTNGGYYTWAAAVANTTSTSANPTTSICPKNWDLPASNQYTNLNTKSSFSSTNSPTAAPSSFLATGKFTNGATFYPTSSDYGFYWSSTSSSTTAAYGARITSSALTTRNSTGTTYGGDKYYRKNIRCVASQGKVTINYNSNGTNEYPTTGSVASQTNAEIASTNIQPGTGLTRTGWTFNNWNTAPDGSGTTLAVGASLNTLNLKPGDTITLYAQWLPQYTITYVNNCKTYANTNSACTDSISNSTSEQKINLANNPSTGTETGTLANYNNNNTWSITGWKIKGWSTVANNSDNSNTEYGTSTTYTVPSGSSVGDGITLYAHWVPVYSIQYDGNGASNPNGMGTTDGNGIKSVKQINVGEGDQVTLLPSNFKRTGYSFAGWSTDPDAWTHFTDNNANNDPIIYGPMETISAPAYPNNGTGIITMYAVWIAAEKDGNNKPIYLQDFGKNECDNLTSATFNSTTGVITPGSVIALTDKRDNEVYTIAKLADGNCWMTENLRLEHAGTVGNNINDSSVTNQSLSQGYGSAAGTYGNFVGLADPESTNFGNTTSNTIYKSDGSGSVFNFTNNTLEDIGTTNYPVYRFPRYNNSNTNSLADSTTYTQDYSNATSPSDSGTNYNTRSNLYSYGNYYTWAAAMANTNYYYSSSTSEATGASICPSNWHLPSSHGTSKEFDTLSQSYGGSGYSQSGVDTGKIMIERFRSFPNSFLYSGYFVGSGMGMRGTRSYYWSRSSYSDSNSYVLNMYGINFSQSFTEAKMYGFSVRCIAGNIYTIQYDGNGADNPNGMGTTNADGVKNVKQVEIKDGTKVTLLASNFKRNSYGFAGWSTDPDAWAHFTDNDNTNDPTIYGPMEDVVINSSVSKQSLITMYAVWVPAEKDGSNNPVYLQDFTTSDCNALTSADFNSATGEITPGSVIALTDKRDNMVYTIAKLADGNCWMTENLRLEHAGTVGNNINDSSVTNQSLSQGYGGATSTYGNFVGLANSESANFTSVTTTNSIYKSDGSGSILDPANNSLEDIGTSSYPAYRFPRYNNNNTQKLVDGISYTQDYTNASSPTDNGTNYRKFSNIYSYGNYYTWAAAMANTNYYTSASASEAAGTSICPSNWHLPSNGTATKEYGVLSQSYGGEIGTASGIVMDSNRFRAFPNNFVSSGNFDVNNTMNRGNHGFYWSRSASTYDFVFHMHFGPDYVYDYPVHSFKYSGYSVRCLIGS